MQALEERGIGRPSTYASILGTIIDRGYVFKRGTALVPAWIAFAVVALLEQHFAKLVDYDFTARMEDDLDRIASGDEQRLAWLKRFYYGGEGEQDGAGLQALVGGVDEIDARAVNSIPIGAGIVLRVGRYGPYVEREAERASVPEDMAPDELTIAKAEELLAAPGGDRALGTDPASGREILVKIGRYGPFVSETLEEGAKEKPRAASLLKEMSPETVTLEDALRLLSLPRTLGEVEGEAVTAQNGRYGPYVKKGTDSRSLASEDELFTVTLEQAEALFAQPKQRGRAAAAPPLKELGADPISGKSMVVKEGALRPLRHRRRDEREPAQGRRARNAHRRACRRVAGRATFEGPGAEAQAGSAQAHREGQKAQIAQHLRPCGVLPSTIPRFRRGPPCVAEYRRGGTR